MSKTLAYGELTITNLTEPFSVILTNEAQQFVTNSSRVASNAQSYYTDIIVYQGSTKRTDYTIGTVSSANGITVSKTSSRVTFAVSANTTITADSGTFTIPITLDGVTINKTFSWSCAKQGATGSTGAAGTAAKLVDITASTQVFKSTDGGVTFSPNSITLTPKFQGGLSFSKWQYSTDGGSSWTDVASGSHNLSISSSVLTINKASDLFTESVTSISFKCIANDANYYDTMTVLKLYDVSDLEIGGTNLQKGTKDWGSTAFANNTVPASAVINNGELTVPNGDTTINLHSVVVKEGERYTVSFDVKGTIAVNNAQTLLVQFYNTSNSRTSYTFVTGNVSTSWNRLSYTFTIPASVTYIQLGLRATVNDNNILTYRLLKLERGNVTTDWSPAPEDTDTEIGKLEDEIDTVNEKVIQNTNTINTVSNTVDEQKKQIDSKVSTTTFNNQMTVLQNNIDKASEGVNKWLIEIYPKTLFNSSDQSKYDMAVFASKANLVPNQSLLVADASLSATANYGDNYIGYGLTFVECDSALTVTTTITCNDAFTLYLNNAIAGTSSTAVSGQTVKLSLRKGWNCLEMVWNEATGSDGFAFGTALSQTSHITSLNCYYASITGRESQIVSKYAELKIETDSITQRVSKTETAVSENKTKIQDLDDRFAEIELTDEKIEMTVSRKIAEIEVGTRNLIRNSRNLIYADYSFSSSGVQLTTANDTVLTDQNGNILTV